MTTTQAFFFGIMVAYTPALIFMALMCRKHGGEE